MPGAGRAWSEVENPAERGWFAEVPEFANVKMPFPIVGFVVADDSPPRRIGGEMQEVRRLDFAREHVPHPAGRTITEVDGAIEPRHLDKFLVRGRGRLEEEGRGDDTVGLPHPALVPLAELHAVTADGKRPPAGAVILDNVQVDAVSGVCCIGIGTGAYGAYKAIALGVKRGYVARSAGALLAVHHSSLRDIKSGERTHRVNQATSARKNSLRLSVA